MPGNRFSGFGTTTSHYDITTALNVLFSTTTANPQTYYHHYSTTGNPQYHHHTASDTTVPRNTWFAGTTTSIPSHGYTTTNAPKNNQRETELLSQIATLKAAIEIL